MPLTNYPNGITSFGIPVLGSGSVPANVGTYWFVSGSNGVDGNSGLDPSQAFATIQYAVDRRGANDVICVAPGAYDETVTISRGLGPLTIVGLGNLGDVGIAPSTVGARGMTNNEDDVTLINVGVAGESTADFACFSTGSRFRTYSCKMEGVDTSGAALGIGPGSVAQVNAGTAGNCGDVNLYNPEFAWSFDGLALVASDYGVPTQVFLSEPRFHNISDIEIVGVPGAFGIGSVRNLIARDGVYDNMEDGTAPSKYVEVDNALDTGSFSGNRFATATNAALVLDIGAGVIWMANATEAGWSVARPA